MRYWTIAFLVATIVALVFVFAGVTGMVAVFAQWLFFICLTLFVVLLILGRRRTTT